MEIEGEAIYKHWPT